MRWASSPEHSAVTSTTPFEITASMPSEHRSPVVEDCSQTALDLLGYDREQLVGTTLDELVSESTTEPGTSRVRLSTADGSEIEAVGGTRSNGESTTFTFIAIDHLENSQDGSTDTGQPDRIDQYRAKLYEVFADQEIDPETTVERALAIGTEYLGVGVAFTTTISDGSQTITRAVGSHEAIQPGETYPLEEAYCKQTIEQDDLLATQRTAASDDVSQEATDTLGLGTYIGKRVVVDGEPYGTVCFADPEAKNGSFRTPERLFVESISNLIGWAIKRQYYEQELTSFQQAIEQGVDGFAILEGDEYVFVDQTHIDMYGYDSKEELLGDTWRKLYNDTEVERLESEVFPELEANGYWRGTVKGTHRDRTTIPTELSLTVIEDDRVICCVRDQRDQRQQETELDLMKRAIDEANVGVQITGPCDEDTPIQYVNQEFEQQTGYSAEAVRGRNPRFLQGEETDPETVAEIREAIAAEEPVSVELINYRKDGTPYWNRLSITPVHDDTGNLTHFIGIMQDVTERRQRAEILQQQREKLDVVLSGTETGVAQWNLETDEIEWDNTLEELIEQPPDSVEEYLELVHPEDRNRVEAVIETVLETGELATAEYRLVAGNKNVIWVNARAAAIFERGDPVRMLATVTEITDQKRTQREAVLANERAQLFTEKVEEYAFITVDGGGSVIDWNRGAERLFGYDEATAEGISTSELIRTDDGTPIAERLRQQARIGGNSSYTGWLVHEDGSSFYADVQYVKTSGGNGEEQRYTAIIHDLTDQHNQQQRTERFVEESVDVVAIADPDGTFEYMSGSVESVLGYEAEQLKGQNAFDLIHPDDQVIALTEFFAAVEDPEYQATTEFRFRDGDGHWRTLEARARNLIDDEAIGGLLVYARDITASKRRDRRFEAVFDQTHQLTGILDLEGQWVDLNKTALGLSGFDQDYILGTPIWETPWWDHSESERSRLREAVDRAADGETVRYDTEILARDGQLILDLSIKPVLDEYGNIAFLVVEGRNTTQRHRHRQHSQVLQRVLRHNIRNDLAKLRGYVELYAETTEADMREQYATVIKTVLDKWESITERVAHIQNILQEQEATNEVVEADDMLTEITATVTETYPEAALETSVSDNLDAELPMEVETALVELIDNAVAAVEETPIISLEAHERGSGWTEFVVADNGPGMPEMEANVLENGEETPLDHGNGLGLWMVRSIVLQAGGLISVDTAETGTTVTLQFRDRSEAAFRQATYIDD